MSTPYELPLGDGKILEIDKFNGELRISLGPYPTDTVLQGDNPPPTVSAMMTYEKAEMLVDFLAKMVDIYGGDWDGE